MAADMAEFKTPAVYVREIPGLTNSVVEVETAVPAFIGYTEVAAQGPNSLHKLPFRIASMFEFVNYFGKEPPTQFDIGDAPVWDLRTSSDAPQNASRFTFVEPG